MGGARRLFTHSERFMASNNFHLINKSINSLILTHFHPSFRTILPLHLIIFSKNVIKFFPGDEPSDYLRKRRLISTIETSPARSLTERSSSSMSTHGNYVGYCTIRNGLPLRELSNISTKHKNVSDFDTRIRDCRKVNREKCFKIIFFLNN